MMPISNNKSSFPVGVRRFESGPPHQSFSYFSKKVMTLILLFWKKLISWKLCFSYFCRSFRCVEYEEARYVSLMVHSDEYVVAHVSEKSLFWF